MAFGNDSVGGKTLLRPAIQSPNYVAGSTGWTINRDGSAEFNNLTIRGNVIIQSSTQGLFVYSGTPASGNLIASAAAAAGVDSFGNHYPQGLMADNGGKIIVYKQGSGQTVYSSLDTTSLTPGQLLQPNSARYPVTGSVSAVDANSDGGTPSAILAAPYASPGAGAQIIVYGTSVGGNNGPRVGFIPDGGVNELYSLVTNGFIKTGATWQIPTLGSGWASGPVSGTPQNLKFRLDGMDNLVFAGVVHTTSATPAGTIFTLPVGYRPANGQRFPITRNTSGTWTAGAIDIGTGGSAGVVTMGPAAAASNMDVHIYGSVPMGNLA